MQTMNFTERIDADIKAALKSKDAGRLRALRAIKSALLLAMTEKGASKEIPEEKTMSILQKMVKQRRDSLEIYREQNRPELAKQEEEEIEVIQQYLPKPLSDEDIEKIIQQIIDQTKASGMQDMGKVMGMATKQLAGKADNKKVAGIVRQKLS
jgi:uncharacterized protein